ncbi:GerMN domain-containing protein [Chamaesiphon sp. VAR_69_metabat_338]|uniref:GerMN domain-containing protein n=1 Tax=Chamaesiphon sp. VAR_69_metabat_338 TaxID=2964704 RepID=UPI00286D6A76|nr:GerMN domain-containing protein [Chamaesiphon sp. VAR_69_metabat_338]
MKILFSNKSAVKQSLLLTIFTALSVWAGSTLLSHDTRQSSVPATISTTTSNDRVQASQPQVYWLRSDRNKITLVAKLLPPNTSSSTPQQVLTIAVQKLLSAKPSDNLSSTIPKGTKLLSLQVRADGVHVDLSPEFRSGGGSTSMIYRVAQVIYTATSLDPNAKVFISVGGQSIDDRHPLGGEGLTLQQPTTRTQFANDFL